MKKIIKFLSFVLIITLFTGCSHDSMEDITIYTSVYPIEYITNILYGTHSKISSIYPSDIDPYTYKLTKKQIKNYSSSDLVIYNGLDKEKNYIVDMLNENGSLKIIDATAKIESTNGMDEIWINPSNMITIAQNIRNGLKEYINSTILTDEIDEKYEKLKLELSTLDASLKETAQNATYTTILVADDDFNILEKYGLNIVSIDPDTITDKELADAKELLNSGDVEYIFVKKGYKETDIMKDLKDNYKAEYLEIDTLNNLSADDKTNNKNYITIMNKNIEALKKELY